MGNEVFSISMEILVSILKPESSLCEPQESAYQPIAQSKSGEGAKRRVSFSKILEITEIDTSS